MGIVLKTNEMNEIDKGTVFLDEGAPVEYICIVLKGRVEVYNQGSRVVLGNGSFLGVADLFKGRCLSSCAALDDTVLYVFAADGIGSIERVLSINKDYRGLLMYSVVRYVNGLYREWEEFNRQAVEIYGWIKECYQKYLDIASKAGVLSVQQPSIEELEEFVIESTVDPRKLAYFRESASVPLDVTKSFYGYGIGLTIFPLEQVAGIIEVIAAECVEMADYLSGLLESLVDEQGNGFLSSMMRLAVTIDSRKELKDIRKELGTFIDKCMDKINLLEELLGQKTGRNPAIDREKIEKMYVSLMTGEKTEEVHGESLMTIKDQLVALKGSMDQILRFAGFEQAEQFKVLIKGFEKLPDKNASDDDTRQLKRGIASLFYDLYEKVFLKAYESEKIPDAVALFLDFGYVSETLLREDEKEFLLRNLNNGFSGQHGECMVYTIREWLTAIFEDRREPSKNDLDMDYSDYVRDLRKQGKILDEQIKEMLQNRHEKLHFEIHNMFRMNHRLVNGQIISFVPILHHDMIMQNMEKNLLTAEKISAAIEKIKQIDYSIFYREARYFNPDMKVDKVDIMKEIYPDFILMPTAGTNASMWQESAGKRRESAGRFIFPVFFQEDLDAIMLKLCGRFRWELCRFLQGSSWNNIKYRSLTSEYCDYLQFYKKNRDLSEEKKEKVRLQIQKGKNNTREIFTSDYEMWIRNEASGSMRLNKPSREILATYCPFSSDIRRRLASQPIFEEAMSRNSRERAKKIHELEQRIRQIAKDLKTDDIPKEIADTLEYYKNN